MKIVFVSNFFNHHQRYLSDALYQLCGGEFIFLRTEDLPDDRKRLGYSDSDIPDYIRDCRIGDVESVKRAQDMICQADVLIAGSVDERLVTPRIKLGKLTFRYHERPLKHGIEPLKYLPRFFRWHKRHPVRKPVYLLSTSAYCASDYAKFGLFKNKAYKWGYFPETVHYQNLTAVLEGKEPRKILWCGRFLDWKHPDDAIMAAANLKAAGYEFQLDFVGTGELQNKMERMVSDLGLQDCVKILGPVGHDEVRGLMEKAKIYLFTSDHREGWGAVLNESMNSGCAVIASHAIGSVPYLLKDGVNGFVYEAGNIKSLTEKLKALLENDALCRQMGEAAYKTVIEEWTADVAAKRFVDLSKQLLAGKKYPETVEFGPCSPA